MLRNRLKCLTGTAGVPPQTPQARSSRFALICGRDALATALGLTTADSGRDALGASKHLTVWLHFKPITPASIIPKSCLETGS